MPRAARILLICLCSLVAFPGAAWAQDDGVFIDPDSPSGREYAIPLEDARRQADPSRPEGRVPQGDRSSALFGEGISASASQDDADQGNSGSGSDPTGNRAAPARQDRRRSAKRREAPSRIVQAAAAHPGAPSGGGSTALLIGGGTLLVLAGGGGIGVALRRRATG